MKTALIITSFVLFALLATVVVHLHITVQQQKEQIVYLKENFAFLTTHEVITGRNQVIAEAVSSLSDVISTTSEMNEQDNAGLFDALMAQIQANESKQQDDNDRISKQELHLEQLQTAAIAEAQGHVVHYGHDDKGKVLKTSGIIGRGQRYRALKEQVDIAATLLSTLSTQKQDSQYEAALTTLLQDATDRRVQFTELMYEVSEAVEALTVAVQSQAKALTLTQSQVSDEAASADQTSPLVQAENTFQRMKRWWEEEENPVLAMVIAALLFFSMLVLVLVLTLSIIKRRAASDRRQRSSGPPHSANQPADERASINPLRTTTKGPSKGTASKSIVPLSDLPKSTVLPPTRPAKFILPSVQLVPPVLPPTDDDQVEFSEDDNTQVDTQAVLSFTHEGPSGEQINVHKQGEQVLISGQTELSTPGTDERSTITAATVEKAVTAANDNAQKGG